MSLRATFTLALVLWLATPANGNDCHDVGRPYDQVPDPTPSEIDDILSRWEASTARVSRVSCRFQRYHYDHVFSVEYRSTGTISLDRYGTVDYQQEPAKIPFGVFSRMRSGRQFYGLRPDKAQKLHYTREDIATTEEDGSTQQVSLAEMESFGEFLSRFPFGFRSEASRRRVPYALPPEGAEIPADLMELPLWSTQLPIARPFVLGLSRAEILAKFAVKLPWSSPEQVRLEFIPRAMPMKEWYSSVKLILNQKDWIPFAIQTEEELSNTRTVYVLKDVSYELKKDE